jgi:hypothetical protein
MKNTYKTIFDKHVTVKVDKKLIKSIVYFLQMFINKNNEHVNFFSTGMVGVYRPVWLDETDGGKWLEEVCGINDPDALRDEIINLPELEKHWKVSTDPTNISFLYMSHIIYNSNLNKNDINDGIMYCIMLANIKHLTSGTKRRFPHAAKESIAMAHFETLDYRNDLKRYGSWYALVESRGLQALEKNFIRKKQLESFEPTEEILRWVNDLQRRDMLLLNGLTESFHKTHAADTRIEKIGRMKEYEGEMEVRPHRSLQSELINAMVTKYSRESDFIRNAIVDDTVSVIDTCDKRTLVKVLKYYSANHGAMGFSEELTTDLVTYMYDQASESGISTNDIPALIDKYRSMIRSSQLNNPLLLRIKEKMGIIINEALPTMRTSKIGATRVGLFIYFTLRVFYINSERR